jgi:rod shape-determining protein MreD
MRRVIILLLTQVLLWALLAELNHGLSGWQVHVFGGALFVVYPALHLGRGEGLLVAGWAGLLCDAHAPVAFGTHGLLFAAAHLLLFRARERVPRQDPISQILVVLFTNLALFLGLSLLRLPVAPAPGGAWGRLLPDLLASQVTLALVAVWFLALQDRLVRLGDAWAELRGYRG